MPNTVVVGKDVYAFLSKCQKGGEIRTYIHPHGKLRGTVDVTAGNLKPVHCVLQLVHPGRASRRGSKSKRIEVILMRK